MNKPIGKAALLLMVLSMLACTTGPAPKSIRTVHVSDPFLVETGEVGTGGDKAGLATAEEPHGKAETVTVEVGGTKHKSLTTVAVGAGVSIAGKKLVGSILDGIDEKISKWMNNAAIQGNNLAMDLLAQLKATADQLRGDLKGDINEVVTNISVEAQANIEALAGAMLMLEKEINNDIAGLTQDTALLIRQSMVNSPLRDFSIAYINNTFVPFNGGDTHTIVVKGVGIGYDSEKIKSELKLVIHLGNGQSLTIAGMPISETAVEFRIPREQLAALRTDKRIALVPATIKAEIVKKRWLWWPKKVNLKASLNLTLAPDYVATISGSVRSPDLQWVRRPDTDIVVSKALPSGHSRHGIHHVTTYEFSAGAYSNPPKVGQLRIASAGFNSCAGSVCGGWNLNHGCTVSPTRDYARCAFENWSHSITVSYRANLQRYEHVGDHTLAYNNISVLHSVPFQIRIPKTFYSASFNGTTREGERFSLTIDREVGAQNKPRPKISGGPLKLLSIQEDVKSYIYNFEMI